MTKFDRYNPVEVCDTRQEAYDKALRIYGKHAKSLGYTVTVAPTSKGSRRRYGIYLVRKS